MRLETGGLYEDWCYYLDPLGLCDESVSDLEAAKKMAEDTGESYWLLSDENEAILYVDQEGEVFKPDEAPEGMPPGLKPSKKKTKEVESIIKHSPAVADLPAYLTGKTPETPTYLYWVLGAGAAALVGYFIFTKVAK